jgi:AcrR family transcriptional regulator
MTEVLRPTLRDRQRQETHQLIRRTVFELAVERGVAAVSVQAICEAAGISARTFFNHFRSKDEALVPDLPEFAADAEDAFVSGAEPDLVTALQVLLTRHLTDAHDQHGVVASPAAVQRLLEANPELVPRAMAVFAAKEQRVAALISRRTGRPTGDLFCSVAAMTATSALRAAVAALPDDGADPVEPLQRLLAEAFDVLRQLLPPRRPRAAGA